MRRLHRRDLNKVWEFLKRSFRDVNLETVEYQRPRSKKRFFETYEEEGVEQLLFVVEGDIVAYTECTYEIIGSDTWINPRYFEKRDMRPLYVEELAVHPDWNGRGVGSFVLEQIQHLAKVRGLTHLVLEVAENNTHAMSWYRKRGFRKLDASVFMAYAVDVAPELLPPRPLERSSEAGAEGVLMVAPLGPARKPRKAAGKAGKKAPEAGPDEKPEEKPPAGKLLAAKKPLDKKRVDRKPSVEKKPVIEKKPDMIRARPPLVGKPERLLADAIPSLAAADAAHAKDEGKNGQRRPHRADTAPPVAPTAPGAGRRRVD